MSDKNLVVKTTNESEVKKLLRNCPYQVQEYVNALQRALDRQKDLTKSAINKIKKLSNEQ